ncbi:hypothetical protein AX774_g6436, partial [Zancudomyces culisetae]
MSSQKVSENPQLYSGAAKNGLKPNMGAKRKGLGTPKGKYLEDEKGVGSFSFKKNKNFIFYSFKYLLDK